MKARGLMIACGLSCDALRICMVGMDVGWGIRFLGLITLWFVFAVFIVCFVILIVMVGSCSERRLGWRLGIKVLIFHLASQVDDHWQSVAHHGI